MLRPVDLAPMAIAIALPPMGNQETPPGLHPRAKLLRRKQKLHQGHVPASRSGPILPGVLAGGQRRQRNIVG
jgi:hypothetical protein